MLRKNYITVDLNAIVHNWTVMKNALPAQTEVMAVVKANAYGHGMVQVARALQQAGAVEFAVATPDEAIELRANGITGEILVLGAAMPGSVEECVRFQVSQTVFTPCMLRLIEKEAAAQNSMAYIHIKIDTGMNRIGLKTEAEAHALLSELNQCSHIIVKGLYTHFCDADAMEYGINDFTKLQLQRFLCLKAIFPDSFRAHCANSAIMLNCPDACFSMVRQGISLYGYPPVHTSLSFLRAFEWKTEVSYVKTIKAGESIGYSRSFVAPKDMQIATVSVGYGDGYHRALSNRGCVLIHGRRAPIVGNVCMDQTMVDVTDIGHVEPGDESVLIGKQHEEEITAEELAAWAGTIPYEVLLAPTLRIERMFIPYQQRAKGESLCPK